jgi:hypothetical protein
MLQQHLCLRRTFDVYISKTKLCTQNSLSFKDVYIPVAICLICGRYLWLWLKYNKSWTNEPEVGRFAHFLSQPSFTHMSLYHACAVQDLFHFIYVKMPSRSFKLPAYTIIQCLFVAQMRACNMYGHTETVRVLWCSSLLSSKCFGFPPESLQLVPLKSIKNTL